MAAGEPWDFCLRKYLMLLATLVATVTYAAGFNPPGGVWQDTDAGGGHVAGDPIIRDTNYLRYAVFFYCNAAAFASSLVVVVLILLLAVLHERKAFWIRMMPLRVVMVLDLLSLMVAYAAGTCRDKLTVVYSTLLVTAVVIYLVFQLLLASLASQASSAREEHQQNGEPGDMLQREQPRKVLMLLATFAVSVTYVAGLSTPGGFWDHNDPEGHHPGEAMLRDHHGARLKAFFVCNTTAFVASLLTIVVLLDRKLRGWALWSWLYGCITVALMGLVGAYAAGSTRETRTTANVLCLVVAVLVCVLFLVKVISRWSANDGRDEEQEQGLSVHEDATDKARSLVLLLATLAATITYQAGLDPPGGIWQDNGDGHMAGDPLLLTTNPRRYKAFFYCNSAAFVASLVAIVLIQNKLLLKHHVLEAAMLLDLFGLIGAYAAGTCRDLSTSVYVSALAGAVLVYVVIHIIFFTLDSSMRENYGLVEKRRKRLLLFAILAATITYQAGLTPPGGFLLRDDKPSGHHAGDPILLCNFPRRYMAFFYCNSVSFMLSIALIILLVNPNLYRPAIRSYALSVCTVAGLFALMGAYAAGSTQHLTTSLSIIVLGAVVSLSLVLLLLWFLVKELSGDKPAKAAEYHGQKEEEAITKKGHDKRKHAKRKYLMLLGILVASVTYQAGLDPPGGVWQSTADGHRAGHPVMHDNRRRRYHAFFYCNSISLVASIVVIIMLLPKPLQQHKWFTVMNVAIVLDLLALLGAYATGSSRDRKTSWNVAALVVAVLGYFAIHITLSIWSSRSRDPASQRQEISASVTAAGQQGSGGSSSVSV